MWVKALVCMPDVFIEVKGIVVASLDLPPVSDHANAATATVTVKGGGGQMMGGGGGGGGKGGGLSPDR
jgi:hypothetical protein